MLLPRRWGEAFGGENAGGTWDGVAVVQQKQKRGWGDAAERDAARGTG